MSTVEKISTIKLKVVASTSSDVGRGLVRLEPDHMEQLAVRAGDVVLVFGEKEAIARVMPTLDKDRGHGGVQMDGILRDSAGSSLGAMVDVRKAEARVATSVVLRSIGVKLLKRDLDYIASLIQDIPVQKGSRVRATLFGNEPIEFDVIDAKPSGPTIISDTTDIQIDSHVETAAVQAPSFEDVGGAISQLQRIREMIELPLKFPELFESLGIDPPRGVLLYGAPGCGKTLIARTIARETSANFFTISGPEIIHKFYGESEAHLRKIFDEASKKGPSIIFIDEIDAIAPKRENASGDVERRVVAQLLALMDGLNSRENVIVLAATNLPNAIDPALRRPGRFDREIEIPVPDREGRMQIFSIHTRGMPLTSDVDLETIAAMTHGYVGADIAALCREAAMACLRRSIDSIDFSTDRIPYDQLSSLGVSMVDFTQALKVVVPSALREVYVEVPDVRWQDVGGLESVKRDLQEAIVWPLTHAHLFAKASVRPAKGLLMTGPPGVGKTLLAKAAATESQVNLISVKGPELLSKLVGESERAVRDIFSKARQAAPCILFFDEVDGLCTTRSNNQMDSGVSDRVLTQFLAEMDGVEELSGVFVLAATNRPDRVDPALRRFGRFETTIEIGLPDLASRQEILTVHFNAKPLAESIDIATLANETEGFSGADLAALCSAAARHAIRRTVDDLNDDESAIDDLLISAEDVRRALESTQLQLAGRNRGVKGS
jgi:transitional endoplasmic reticulum ATPase